MVFHPIHKHLGPNKLQVRLQNTEIDLWKMFHFLGLILDETLNS